MNNYYKKGTWNVICDVCGFKFKSDQVKQRWDGYVVCSSDYESRHPQDFLRSRNEQISVPFTRPEPVDTYVTVAFCSLAERLAIVGYAVAGCARAGNSTIPQP